MAEDPFLLLNPGPVPLSDDVRAAMAESMVSHRSDTFSDVYRRAAAGLEYVFTQSSQDGRRTAAGGESLIFNGTATMAMEAAVANLVGDVGAGSTDEVVAVSNGKFGRRFARIADRYTDCSRVTVPWGESLSVDAVAAAVSDDTAMVTMVHNETSTGLRNPVGAIGAIAAEHDALFVVDGVTSIGGDEFLIDEWNVDIAIVDGQKALAAPPGVSGMYLSDQAVNRIDGDVAPFYQDLEAHVEKAVHGQTPFTSAVPLFRGLAVAVDAIEAEGMTTRIDRHHRQAAALRAGFTAMGLDLFPDPTGDTSYSNTVTAVTMPNTLDADGKEAFFAAVADHNVSIAGGQAHLDGELFRVSNMGAVTQADLLRGVHAIGESFRTVGVDLAVDAGVAAVESAFSA